MKRIVLLFLIVSVAALGAFGQSLGSTWYDPQDTTNSLFPTTLPNYVTNGIFAGEFDYLYRAPSRIAEYEGYGVFTGYGNYETLHGTTGWMSPFTTDVGAATGTLQIGNYQLGATFPLIGDMRAGALIGKQYTLDGYIFGATNRQFIENTTTDTTDGGGTTLGTADFTETQTFTATDKVKTSSMSALTGVAIGDLGPLADIGASLYFANSGTSRKIGGSRTYTWTEGTDTAYTPPNNQLTSETIYIGYEEEGAVGPYAGSGTTIVGVVGQLGVGSLPGFVGLTSVISKTALPEDEAHASLSESYAYVNTFGAGGAATDVTTQSMESGVDLDSTATWTTDPTAGANAIDPTWSAVPTAYVDPAESKDGGFDFTATFGVEPVIEMNDNLAFRTKGALMLMNERSTDNFTRRATSSQSAATSATEANTWSYTYSQVSSSTDNTFTVGGELGGIAEFSDSEGIVSLGVGLFAMPSIGFGSTSREPTVTTIDRSFTDAVNTNPATLAAAQGALGTLQDATEIIALGNFEGTSTYTSTTTWSEDDTERVTALTLDIPVAVKVSMFEGALEPFFGYTMKHESERTTTTTVASDSAETATVTDGTTTVFDSANTTHYPAGQSLDDNDTSTTTDTVVNTSSTWSGIMAWGLRWNATESLTIDIEGGSITTALNNLGLNDLKLDDLLQMNISAIFRFAP